MISSIRIRCHQLRPWPDACCSMVPSAPTMSPTCAESITADDGSVAAGGVFRPRGPDENPDENNDMVLPFDSCEKSGGAFVGDGSHVDVAHQLDQRLRHVGHLGDGEWISSPAEHRRGFTAVPPRHGRGVRTRAARGTVGCTSICGTAEHTPISTPAMKRCDEIGVMNERLGDEGTGAVAAIRPVTKCSACFRPRTTEPGCGRGGTTLNLDTDEVYRWYSLCSSPPRSRDARGRRVPQHIGEDARTERPHEHPSRQSFGTARRIRDRNLRPEATWAQPLSREELS